MTSILGEGNKRQYSLPSTNATMVKWLDHIIGFDIAIDEIVGRFKLSQDKSERDKTLAMTHLLKGRDGRQDNLIRALAFPDPTIDR